MTALLVGLAGAVATLVQEIRRRSARSAERASEAAAATLRDMLHHAREDVTRLEGVIRSRDQLLEEALDACTDSTDPRAALVRVRLALDPTGAARARLQARDPAPDP